MQEEEQIGLEATSTLRISDQLCMYCGVVPLVLEKMLQLDMAFVLAVPPLVWVRWVPRNPSIFEQWVLEPINF